MKFCQLCDECDEKRRGPQDPSSHACHDLVAHAHGWVCFTCDVAYCNRASSDNRSFMLDKERGVVLDPR